eukprot:1140042-Rhodomonas_salina.2
MEQMNDELKMMRTSGVLLLLLLLLLMMMMMMPSPEACTHQDGRVTLPLHSTARSPGPDPIVIPLNLPNDGVAGMMSYPNFPGPCRVRTLLSEAFGQSGLRTRQLNRKSSAIQEPDSRTRTRILRAANRVSQAGTTCGDVVFRFALIPACS